jgi:trans-aconitate methyltransferase
MNNKNQIKKDTKTKYFNRKYFSLKNFRSLKRDFKFILNYFDKAKIKFTNKNIIDIGCGNASFTYFLKKKFKNNKYFALDNHKQLIDFNKKNKLLEDVKFYNKPMHSKFSNIKFDLITLSGTLCLVQNQKKVINNLLKHLAKNGLLVISCYFNKYNIDVNINYTRYLKNNIKLNNAIYIKSLQDMKKFISSKKFSILDVKENYYPKKIKRSENLNMYTLKINKKNIRSNDLNVLYDQYLMVIKN